jgi:hypothetical protein
MSKSMAQLRAEFDQNMQRIQDAIAIKEGKKVDQSPGARERRTRAQVRDVFDRLFGGQGLDGLDLDGLFGGK